MNRTQVRKTQAMRALDARQIRYTAVMYDADAAFHSAADAATLLGVAPHTVYKTLVVLSDEQAAKPMLVMIAATREIDLKRLATQVAAKKLRMATRREAEQLTGMEAGGISALAVRKGRFDVYLDAPARELDVIHVSAGVRGVDLAIAVPDLVAATGARFLDASNQEASTVDSGQERGGY